jgi:uncharacterized protein
MSGTRRMQVVAVGQDQHRRPLLLLREAAGRHRLLPVWIGQAEATAILTQQQHVETPRPRSHALIANVITACGRHVLHVSITALRDNVFHAELVFDHGTRVSARPSDAVALALHLNAAIHADESVLEHAGLSESEVDTINLTETGHNDDGGSIQEWEIQQFHQFLNTATPEDFDPQ